jgi:hypothetical protein
VKSAATESCRLHDVSLRSAEGGIVALGTSCGVNGGAWIHTAVAQMTGALDRAPAARGIVPISPDRFEALALAGRVLLVDSLVDLIAFNGGELLI